MTVIAIILTLLATYLMQEQGKPTQNKHKKIGSYLFYLISFLITVIEFGTLRGIIIFLALVSIIGTLFTLLLHKLTTTDKANTRIN